MIAADRIVVGMALPLFVVERIEPDRMRTMAALLDDPTPIHLDAAEARRQGFEERRVNQGPMAIGYALEMLARWCGDPDAPSDLRLRFVDNVFEGERLECSGTVTAVDGPAGACTVEIAIRCGERLVGSGSASVRLG